MANKRVKAVSFNLDRDEEQRLWKHVSKRNFSGYVKKLIQADIERKAKKSAITQRANSQPYRPQSQRPNQQR